MNYGDFSSVVQLGVGLHLGTALLNLYGDFGLQKLVRTLVRLSNIEPLMPVEAEAAEIKESIADLNGRFSVFQIEVFNETKRYIIINSIVAAVLAVALIWLAFCSQVEVSPNNVGYLIALSALAVMPAPITLLALWIDAKEKAGDILKDAAALELKVSQFNATKAKSLKHPA